ncbi:diguanylate cyclase [Anaerolinea sp.]|uniref:sensor domain-containing diguanylate cyclase n=1 Tax=Anaerolinea sp. TaxID=1872519 RepID=UPI002ACDA5E0|nr:diguanylate cyclase [Anaerolinea sp.]
MVVGLIRLDILLSRTAVQVKDRSILTWLAKESGEVLAHPNPAWIKASMSQQPFWRQLQSNPAPVWAGKTTNLDGALVFMVASKVEGTSWVVFSEVPFSKVRSASLRAMAILGVGVLILIMGLSYWSRWYLRFLIFNPLNQLRMAMHQVMRGERDVHFSVEKEDELGDLASAFNAMLEHIREHETQLEERHQALELETARRKHAMLELQRMAEQLEERVKVRTAELEHEIAERRQTEQELRLNLQRLELLNRLLNVHNPENMLEEMCRVLAQALNASILLLIREHSNARLQVRAAFLPGEASLMERMDPQSDALFRVFHGNHNRVSSIAISRLDSRPPFLTELVKLQVEHLLLLRQTPAGAAEAFLVVGRDRHQPFEPMEIQTLEVVATGVLQVIELALLYASLNDELAERRRIETLLVHQNTRDTLTGLYNRRVFEERISYRAPHTMPVCLIVLDLDHLKRVNDTFGHTSGDEYIRLVAQAIQASVRSEDMAARIGEDEFVVILNGADESAGEAVMQRIQESLYSMLDPQNPVACMVRVSMGLAISLPGEPLLETYRRADSAMYAQKQLHRQEEAMDSL